MRLQFMAAAALFALAPGLFAQDVTAQLDSALRAAEQKGFSGVVRIERNGAVLLEKGYGFAHRETKAPFTPATVVQIGSNTKDFTAVAILQLQAAGKLSLSDSLPKYFANVPADKRGITLRQLLNHRAGFPLAIAGDFEPFTRAQLVDSAMKTALLFPPGTREGYSNPGYSLLAAIIEQVTGKTYDRHIHDAIIVPAGLTRTGFLLPGFGANDLAHGYNAAGRDEGTMLAKPHAADGPHWNLRGNGGMLSTAADMAKFYRVLFDSEKLLSREARGGRFAPDEPVGLAGSDGVNMFLFDRFPMAGTEIIIASTNAAMKAGMIRKQIGPILGLPDPDGEPNEQAARRTGGTPAGKELVTLMEGFAKALNSGDAGLLRAFVTEHFASEPGSPTVDERVERLGRMHENLGVVTLKSIDVFASGPADVAVTSSVQGRALLKVTFSATAPVRIQGLQVLIGG
jgi:CubicO group peptidase (beta-lactamase class C family)